MYNPYLLKDIILVIQKNCDISGEINVKMCIIEKSKKNHGEKKIKLIFFETVEKNDFFAHETIQWLNYVLHYLNMKIKGKWVEIMDLKFCSSLKWDGV